MKTLKDLTPEIEAKIPLYIEKVLKGVYNEDNYRNFDIEKVKKAIYWNYDFCGYKKPIVIVVENIYEQQLLFNFIVANKDYYMPILYLIYSLENKLDSELDSKLFSKLDSELFSKLYSELFSKLNSKLDSKLDSKLYFKLYSKLNSKLDSELFSKLYSELNSKLSSKLDSELFSKLNSKLDSKLDSELFSKLYSELDSKLYSKLSFKLDSKLSSKLYSKLNSELYSELDSKLSSKLYSKLSSKLDSELSSKLYSKLSSKLYSKLFSKLYSELYSELNSKLESELNKYNNCYLFTLNINSCVFYNYYEFIRKEFNLELSINDTFQECFKLQKESNIYSAIFSELICIVSKFPKKININKDYNLHCENDCAVEWGNEIINFNNYYWKGVNVPEQLIMNPETITKQNIISINNAEVRRCYMEKLGAKKYYEIAFGGITLIDEQIDEYDNPLKLYRSKEKDDIINDYVYFIEVVCPSTKRVYNLFPLVEKYPKSKECVLHAVASTFNKNKVNYKPLKQS